MRRAISTAAATLAGFGAVLGLHSTNSRTGAPAASAPSSPATTGPPATTGGPATTGPGTAGPAGPQAPSTTAPAGQSRAVTGAAENYGYGILAVKLTMNGGRISDVSISGLRVAESYSQMIAQQVVPILRHEVLSAQSARVSTISGATYTSEAYLASVQSALDKAHS